MMREQEAHGTHEVRCQPEQDLTLVERTADQPELVLLEIAKATVDELGGGRRGSARQISLLRQHDGEAAARSIARDATAIDAAADDCDVPHAVRVSHAFACAEPPQGRGPPSVRTIFA